VADAFTDFPLLQRHNLASTLETIMFILTILRNLLLAIGAVIPASLAVGLAVLLNQPQLFQLILIAFSINLFVFIPSASFQTEKFYDLTGSITFIVLSIYSLYLRSGGDFSNLGQLPPRNLIATACVLIWAFRLGIHLFRRILRDKEDKRFSKIKQNPLRFLHFWTFQAFWAFFTAVAVYSINMEKPAAARQFKAFPVSLSDVLGFSLWLIGFSMESLADQQKSKFRSNPANKDKFISEGLWYYSRHPNYFGEFVLWLGVFVLSIGSFTSEQQYWAILGPITEAFMICCLSGIPPLENAAEKKWKDDKQYKHYKQTTPILVPNPFKK
jgi:steroid 5-alpha reductase family enzyme